MTNLESRALFELASRLNPPRDYLDYADKPLEFVRDVLRYTLWEKQEEVVESVRRNRFTVVPSGQGVGKSISASLLVAWWLSTREEAKVVTLAPTWAQVANILWRYVKSLSHRAKLPGTVLNTPRWNISPDRFGIGLSPKKTSMEDMASLQGYHSPNLLVILDEAPGVNRILWDALRGLAVGDNNRILALGNPIEQSGPFWDAENSENWHKVQISCLEHPNVVQHEDVIPGAVSYTWVKEMLRDHCQMVGQMHDLPDDLKLTRDDIIEIGRDLAEVGIFDRIGQNVEESLVGDDGLSDNRSLVVPAPDAFLFEGVWYRPNSTFEMRVLGRAPVESSSQLISLAWVMSAQRWEIQAKPPTVIGFDPARYGGDAATMVARAGPKVLWVKRRWPTSRNPGVELAGWLKEEMSKLAASVAYVDEIGIGASVVDQCRVLNLPVRGVAGSNVAYDAGQFTNMRTELWWKIKQRLQQGALELPRDALLESDLVAPRYGYDEKGRKKLERKEDVQVRLGRSPDSGDALALTFASPSEGTLPEGTNPVRELKSEKQSRWFVASKPKGSRWRKFRH